MDVSGTFITTAHPSSRNNVASVRSEDVPASSSLRSVRSGPIEEGMVEGSIDHEEAVAISDKEAFDEHSGSVCQAPADCDHVSQSLATLEDGSYHLENALSDPHD